MKLVIAIINPNRLEAVKAEPTISAIIKGAQTGEVGDGKIFILDLVECIRIRTEERGGAAIG
ncbi:MAG: hypothetical protein NTX36_02585 [Proteobacteria bacterium]|nr:hypothetical protein [Pseudomonadota bacterium]